jgi:hypothetical protein
MKTVIWTAVTALHLAAALPAPAAETGTAPAWQETRLLAPTTRQQAAESKGGIFIYDGLHEDTVNLALDSQFRRIQNMMFIRVKHTDPAGDVTEDDDCD